MKMFIQGLLLGCLALGISAPAHAQAKKTLRARVSVVCSCDDTTGKQYAEALHTALSTNQNYREIKSSEATDDSAIRISIVSMPLDQTNDGRPPRSALSIVCIHHGAIIHQFVETCAHISIADCAQSMLSDLLEWEADSRA